MKTLLIASFKSVCWTIMPQICSTDVDYCFLGAGTKTFCTLQSNKSGVALLFLLEARTATVEFTLDIFFQNQLSQA